MSNHHMSKEDKIHFGHAQAQPLVQSCVMLCLLAIFQCFGSNKKGNNPCLVLLMSDERSKISASDASAEN